MNEKWDAPIKRDSEEGIPAPPPVPGAPPGTPTTPESIPATPESAPTMPGSPPEARPTPEKPPEPEKPRSVERPRAIDQESLHQRHEGSPTSEQPVMLDDQARRHAASRGLGDAHEIREMRKAVERDARVKGVLTTAAVGMAAYMIDALVTGVALTGSGLVWPVGFGVTSGLLAYNIVRQIGAKKIQETEAAGATPPANGGEGYQSIEGAADDTIRDGESRLTLPEAIRRGVVQADVQYQLDVWWKRLVPGRSAYRLTAGQLERLKKDNAYRNKLLHGAPPGGYYS